MLEGSRLEDVGELYQLEKQIGEGIDMVDYGDGYGVEEIEDREGVCEILFIFGIRV